LTKKWGREDVGQVKESGEARAGRTQNIKARKKWESGGAWRKKVDLMCDHDVSKTHLGRLELPERDINGDTTLTLGLELVENPGVLERGLAHLSSLLLELLNDTLVNTTALVDEVASGGGLTGIDVADDDNVDVLLLLGHLLVTGAVADTHGLAKR